MSTRKGSALLIVLGMLSFMVVSAVGFSMFMRQSRLPSSYLRRNVASRYLVKAALANAIEELDCGWMSLYDIGESENDSENGRIFGIYDDPYPGCGPCGNQSGMDGTTAREFNGQAIKFSRNGGNYWFKRVFCPFGPLPLPATESDGVDYPPLTVPTLTLEALAYLPPAIIDDVRQMSRATRTAQWHSLPFESGRYAYTAVNVSDLFDINRLRASEPRDSGLNRITMASLTSQNATDPLAVDDGLAEQLDNLIDPEQQSSLKVGGQVVPFVSLADFALMLANSPFSPFSRYIGSANSSILQNGDANVANAAFVTDSWFPPTNAATAGVTYDLAGGHQPFKEFTAGCALEVLLRKNPQDSAGDIFERNLGPGLMCLYDYLDSDSKPISLAFPTTEAVPMVVAVGAPMGFQPQFVTDTSEKTELRTVNNYQYDVKRTVTKHSISSFQNGSKIVVNAAVMYPFKRMSKTKRYNNISFKARGVMRVFLMPELNDKTQYFDGKPSRPTTGDLRLDDPNAFNQGTMNYARGIATFASDPVDLNFGDDMLTQDSKKWIDNVNLFFDTDGINLAVFQKVHEDWVAKTPAEGESAPPPITKTDANTLDGAIEPYEQQQPPTFRGVLSALKPSGEYADEASWYGAAKTVNSNVTEPGTTPGTTLDNVTPFGNATKYKLFTAIWIQIADASGEVYDMVPAGFDDDTTWLRASGAANPSMAFGEGSPLLTFITDYPSFTIDQMPDAFGDVATFANDKTALFVPDPRFNHAPENWFYLTVPITDLQDKWCTLMGATGNSSDIFGKDGRDRDVFMFVSDQEYLQDIGELQFLPALHDMTGTGAMVNDSEYSAGTYCDGRHYTDGGSGLVDGGGVFKNTFMDGDYFWRTYNAYDTGFGDPYPIYALPFTTGNAGGIRFHSGVGKFKVNPYSDDERVLAAALAGTPFDYYVASTNNQQLNSQQRSCKQSLMDSIETLKDARNYSFCSECNAARLEQSELLDILDRIQGSFAGLAATGVNNWEQAWNQLHWQEPGDANIGDNNSSIMGDVLVQNPLHGIDRKFLYSFWRECFDNRQQLFLIFVRAEPTSIGGGAAGNVSSAQLGGRAVALVWRDPMPIADGVARTVRQAGQSIRAKDFREQYKADHTPHRTRVLFYHQFD